MLISTMPLPYRSPPNLSPPCHFNAYPTHRSKALALRRLPYPCHARAVRILALPSISAADRCSPLLCCSVAMPSLSTPFHASARLLGTELCSSIAVCYFSLPQRIISLLLCTPPSHCVASPFPHLARPRKPMPLQIKANQIGTGLLHRVTSPAIAIPSLRRSLCSIPSLFSAGHFLAVPLPSIPGPRLAFPCPRCAIHAVP